MEYKGRFCVHGHRIDMLPANWVFENRGWEVFTQAPWLRFRASAPLAWSLLDLWHPVGPLSASYICMIQSLARSQNTAVEAWSVGHGHPWNWFVAYFLHIRVQYDVKGKKEIAT